MNEIMKSWKLADGRVLEIHQDETPPDPRDDDNISIMICSHRRYNLGDKDHSLREDQFDGWSDLKRYLVEEEKAIAILPLWLIDHSGISMRTHSFDDCDPGRWDSGIVGFIYTTEEQLRKVGHETIPERKELEDWLRSDVALYDLYLRGQCFGYILKKAVTTCPTCQHTAEGEEEESLWGIYPDEDKGPEGILSAVYENTNLTKEDIEKAEEIK